MPGADAPLRIGELTAPTLLCELGDVTRLWASRKAVRCAGLDIGVHRVGKVSHGLLQEADRPVVIVPAATD